MNSCLVRCDAIDTPPALGGFEWGSSEAEITQLRSQPEPLTFLYVLVIRDMALYLRHYTRAVSKRAACLELELAPEALILSNYI